MPSADRSAGGSLDSSTPGPAMGDPDSATKRRDPSRDSLTPRGRLPTGTCASTAPVDPSRNAMVPAVSLETYTTVPAPDAAACEAGAPDEHAPAQSASAIPTDARVEARPSSRSTRIARMHTACSPRRRADTACHRGRMWSADSTHSRCACATRAHRSPRRKRRGCRPRHP